jgi:uncharacterized repeat protein (TIGR03803 family)
LGLTTLLPHGPALANGLSHVPKPCADGNHASRNNAPAAAASRQTLYSFCEKTGCTDGTSPSADLAMDAAGHLFGTTTGGGTHGSGTLFEMQRNLLTGKWQRHVLHNFCASGYPCHDGTTPTGRLVIDALGNLYGTASGGNTEDGGVAFVLVRNLSGDTWTYHTLYAFCARAVCADGKNPASGLTYAGEASGAPYDGMSPLYGTTRNGGAQNAGTAFQLVPAPGHARWAEHLIHSFCARTGCADGSQPWQSLTMDSKGDLFGVTYGRSDAPHAGLVFELTPIGGNHWTETVLHAFCQAADCADGRAPNALVMDASGNLFGTVYGGGANGQGLVFRLTPNGVNSAYAVLYNFCSQTYCYDGAAPSSALMLDASGNLYGTTYYGGIDQIDRDSVGGGTVFRLTHAGVYTVMQNFCAVAGCADGEYPNAGVVMDASGALYGTTQLGGSHTSMFQGGTVFRLAH